MRTLSSLLSFFGALALAGCADGDDGVPGFRDQDTEATDAASGVDDLEIHDGLVYREGDMILGTVDEVFGDTGGERGNEAKRQLKSVGATNSSEGFVGTTHPWTHGEIRWRFDEEKFTHFTDAADEQRRDDTATDFRAAIEHFSERTTLRFAEVENTNGSYVSVTRDTNACASHVGMLTGEQLIELGHTDDDGNRDCLTPAMVHELGHTAGLEHESERPDRDSYITVGPSSTAGAPFLPTEVSLLSDYDVLSMMHYSGDITFAGTATPVPRNRKALTFLDIQGIQLMYGDQLSPLASSPAGTAKLELFYRSSTGKVGHRTLNGNSWTSQASRGAPHDAVILGAPLALSRDGTTIDLIVLGADDRIYHQSYDGTSWSVWTAIGTNAFRSQPAAVVRTGSAIHIVAVDKATGTLRYNTYDGVVWDSWTSLGGIIVGTPSLVSTDEDQLEVFALGKKKTLLRKSWTSAKGWDSNWTDDGGTFRGVPTVLRAGDRVDILAKNEDSKLVYRAYYPLTKHWNTMKWRKISDKVVIGNPQFTHAADGVMNVVMVGSNQKLYAGTNSVSDPKVHFTALQGKFEGSPFVVQRGDVTYALGRATDDSIQYKSVSTSAASTWTESFESTGGVVSW